MNFLASDLLHDSCAVRVCVERAYLGVFWNCGDHCGTTGSIIGILGDSAVVGIGDCSTFGYSAVLGIGVDGVGALVVTDVASISCRFLMACGCSSPTANGDAGYGLLSASVRSSTAWRASSVDDIFGTGQLCGKIPLS